MIEERDHADFAGENAHRTRSKLACGHVPEEELLGCGLRGLGFSTGSERRPVGRESEPLGRTLVSRQGSPEATRQRVPEDDAASRVTRRKSTAVRREVDAADRRLVVPEQRYLAAAQPPEIPPGEIEMRRSWSVDVIEEDFLGALELPRIARLVGQSQLGGVEVPVCERLAVHRKKPLPIGLTRVAVGPLDLSLQPLVVRLQPGVRPGHAAGRSTGDEDGQSSQGGVGRPAACPLQACAPRATQGEHGSAARRASVRGPRPRALAEGKRRAASFLRQ